MVKFLKYKMYVHFENWYLQFEWISFKKIIYTKDLYLALITPV